MSDEEDKGLSKRELRRKRRIKNQIISYVVSVLFIIGVIVGIFFCGKTGIKLYEEKKQDRIEKEQAEVAAAEEAKEVKETPEVDAVEPVEETTDYLDELVNTYISEMTLEDKVAGLFLVTPESLTGVSTVIKAGDGTKAALEKYPVGGLVYFSKNIVSSDQLKEMMTNTVMYSKYPLFLAVDEEGGAVSRLGNSKIGVEKTLDASEIGVSSDAAIAKESAGKIGTYLIEYGFNLDFAPVADVLTNPNNTVIGKRSYSGDASVVSNMIEAAILGLQEKGVSACMKHFPGIGEMTQDPHEGSSSIDKTLEDLRATEFLPFEKGIATGVDSIMVSNVLLPKVLVDTPNTPCSLSSVVITDILRTELGFKGVVVTDAMDMKAITDSYTSAEAAVQAIQAGADVILMPENFEEAYQGLLDAVSTGAITEDRIDESLHRIYRVKYKSALEQ